MVRRRSRLGVLAVAFALLASALVSAAPAGAADPAGTITLLAPTQDANGGANFVRQLISSEGRAIWEDFRSNPSSTWSRSVSRSESTLTAGTERLIRQAATSVGMSASGRRVAFLMDEPGGDIGIYLSVGGGPASFLRSNATSDGLSVSGTRMLVAPGDSLIVEDLLTGAETPVPGSTDPLGVQNRSLWGDQVAFLKSDGSVWRWQIGSASPVRMTGPQSADFYRNLPMVSHDVVAWSECTFALNSCTTTAQNFRTNATVTAPGQLVDLSGAYVETATDTAYIATPLSGGGAATSIPGSVLDGTTIYYSDAQSSTVNASALPPVPLPARFLGNAAAPTRFTATNGRWSAEFPVSKPLPTCSVAISSGANVVRTLDCATTDGSALASWDGRDSAGALVPDGNYTWTLTGSDEDGALLNTDGSASPITGTIAVSGTPVPPEVPRLSGSNRFGTAVAIARDTFASQPPREVMIANGLNYPDALAASPLGAGDRPMLLVRPDSVPPEVTTYLNDLTGSGANKLARVWIFGGTGAVNDAVAQQLAAYGPVQRVSGPNRYATAAKIADAVVAGVGRSGTAYLATGQGYADALGAASAAAKEASPILLTTSNALSPETAEAIGRLGVTRVVIVGGTGAVSSSVQAAVDALPGVQVQRRSGTDRYETAAVVNGAVFNGSTPIAVAYLATGKDFPDALAGGAAAAASVSPIALTRPECMPAVTQVSLSNYKAGTVKVLGGKGAVSDEAARGVSCG